MVRERARDDVRERVTIRERKTAYEDDEELE